MNHPARVEVAETLRNIEQLIGEVSTGLSQREADAYKSKSVWAAEIGAVIEVLR